MTAATFLVGIVLALVLCTILGAALASVWMRARAAPAKEPQPTEAAQPVADMLAVTLARIEAQMRDFESARQHSLGGLEANLASLSRETAALGNALRSPNARGRWGELTLRRVAELSGMVPFCDFV